MKNRNYKCSSSIITLIFLFTMAFIALSAVNSASASTAVIYVNDSHGDDSWDGTSWATAKLSIKNATGTVSEGGTVSIANGVYTGTGNTNITITKNMTITGQSKNKTIINAQGTNTIFTVNSGFNVIIQNLTITNATGSFLDSPIVNNGTMKISNSIFTDNDGNFAGVIYNTGNLTVTNSNFKGNTVEGVTFSSGGSAYFGSSGAAIFNNRGNCTVTYSTFLNNYAKWCGGAIYNNDNGKLTVIGSSFINNSAYYCYGGAIYNVGTAILNFNQISGNSTDNDIFSSSAGSMNAENNWWGSNAGSSDKIRGTTVFKWLVLTITAIPTTIKSGEISTITANLLYDNTGVYHEPTGGHVPDGTPVYLSTTLGTLNSKLVYVTNGIAKSTLKGGLTEGTAKVLVKVDDQTMIQSVAIKVPPKVVSTYPKRYATGVSRTRNITIKFSEKIKASSYWSKIVVKNKYGHAVSISKSISGNVLYIKTKYKRSSYSYYTVYIPKAAVKDYAGNNLAAGYTFKFKTGRY